MYKLIKKYIFLFLKSIRYTDLVDFECDVINWKYVKLFIYKFFFNSSELTFWLNNKK